jgi:hypothetical protein
MSARVTEYGSRTMAAIAAVLLSLSTAACGPDIEDICEDFSDDCNGEVEVERCVEEGETLEFRAEQIGCEAEFDQFLECIDDAPALCQVDDLCEAPRNILEECGVEF